MKFAKPELIKSLIFVVIFIVVLTVFDIPMSRNIGKIFQDFKNERELLALEYASGNYFEKSYENYQDLNSKIPSYENILILQGNELALITKLERLANENSLEQNLNMSSMKSNLSSKIEKLNLKIHLTGTYNDLVDYLIELKDMNFEITTAAFDIKKFGKDSLEANLLTNTYWLVD